MAAARAKQRRGVLARMAAALDLGLGGMGTGHPVFMRRGRLGRHGNGRRRSEAGHGGAVESGSDLI